MKRIAQIIKLQYKYCLQTNEKKIELIIVYFFVVKTKCLNKETNFCKNCVLKLIEKH